MLLNLKFIGTLKKILLWVLIAILAIPVAGYLALQYPQAQTYVTQKVIGSLSDKIDGKISIGRVHMVFFNRLIVQDFAIVSTKQSPLLDSLKQNYGQSDTLLACKFLSVSLESADIRQTAFKLKSVSVKDGVFNLQNEEGPGYTNLNRIFKSDKDKVKDTSRRGFPFNLLASSVKVKNFRFSLNNPDRAENKADSIVNFSNLRVSDINVDIRNVRIENDTIFGKVKNISGTDASGFRLQKLSGNIEISPTESRLNEMYLSDGHTIVNARYFSMKYNTIKDFSDFINNVELELDMDDTHFSFKTIGKITPSLSESSLGLKLNGKVSGPICDLTSSNLKAQTLSGLTDIDIDFNMTGLPDIRQTMTIIEINECYTTSREISKIVASITGSREIEFLRKLNPKIRYKFKGNLIGLPDDFVAHGNLSSKVGEIDVDVLLKNDRARNGYLIEGFARSKDFNVGTVISNKMLGEVSMDAALEILCERKEGVDITIDSVKISKVEFNNYPYSNIFAIGKYNNKMFDGRIICHDPNLDFIFQGLFSVDAKAATSKYNFYADIPYANLSALNIDKRDTVSVLKTRAIADLTSYAGKDIVGNLNVLNTFYTNSKGDFNIGSIKLTSHEADSSYSATLQAPFIDVDYNATAPISSFLKKFAALTAYDHAGSYFSKGEKGFFGGQSMKKALESNDEYELKITTSNSRSICELLMPGLYIQDSTCMNVNITKENLLDFNLKSGRVAITPNYIKGVDLNISNRDSVLKMNLASDNILVAGVRMDSASVQVNGSKDLLRATFGFKNDSTENNYAYLSTQLGFKPDTVDVGINGESSISLKGNKWNFRQSNIIFADSSILFKNFNLNNGNQHISANGFLSKARKDSLALSLNNFDIKILNLFMNRPFKVEGYFSGAANLSLNRNNSNIFADITGDSVFVYNNPVGKLKIMGKWYNPDKRFNILVNAKKENKTNFHATGYYKPKENALMLGAELEDMSVAYFEPFLSDLIEKTSGTLTGKMKLHGPLDELVLEGEECNFKDFNFLVKYTQVPYTLSGPVNMNENGLFAKDLTITDQFGNKGKVRGGLKYKFFRNPELDTRIEFQNMQCLSTEEKDNDTFYGGAFATGSLNIKGPFNKLLLDINVIPATKTALHIPLSSSATATQTNLLTFKKPEKKIKHDPYELMVAKSQKEKVASQLQVKLKANMNTNAEMLIEINKSLGDIISANGSGLINLDINPAKDVFDIFGDYNINQGKYKFVLSGFGFAAKDFMIQPGGIIHFNGALENTTINLTAVYKTKAAINTLIADTSAVSTRRNVNCEIMMSGNLMNPELKFNINIPDLDPTTKVRVDGALNTEGKIQKQFAALLISGGFLPDEQSGITNNSTILYSNVSEMLSNQINNIFQQLGIPLDLGLNYQPGEKGNTDIFDVAVSTQLFNNRLLINGNIGNDPYANSSNNRGVIGNVDVEYKLDKSGKLRVTAFSHAADQYSNYLDDSQRSGVGISYQQEFNRLKEIFLRKKQERIRKKALKRKATRKEDHPEI